jgi:hypothetical protein
MKTIKFLVHFYADDGRFVAEETITINHTDYFKAADLANEEARMMLENFGAESFTIN